MSAYGGVCQWEKVKVMTLLNGKVLCLAQTHDSKYLFVGYGDLNFSGNEGSIDVYRFLEDDNEINSNNTFVFQTLCGHTKAVSGLDVSSDDSILASSSFDATVRIWCLKSFSCLRTISDSDDIGSVKISRNMKYVFSGGRIVKMWKISGEFLRNLSSLHIRVKSIELFSDEKRIAAASHYSEFIHISDIDTGTTIKSLVNNADIYSLCLSNDNKYLISGDKNNIKFWNCENWNCERTINQNLYSYTLINSPYGETLLSLLNQTIMFYDINTTSFLNQISTSMKILDGFKCLVMSQDGCKIAAGADNKSIYFYQLPRSLCINDSNLDSFIKNGISLNVKNLFVHPPVTPSQIVQIFTKTLNSNTSKDAIFSLATIQISFIDFGCRTQKDEFLALVSLLANERFQYLNSLVASHCNLTVTMTAPLVQLKLLKHLDISNNTGILTVPALPPNLNSISVCGCPFYENIPSEMKIDSNSSSTNLLTFLTDLFHSSETMYRSKLIVLGAGAVGKSAIVDALSPMHGMIEFKDTFGFKKRECFIQNNVLKHISSGHNMEKDNMSLLGCTCTIVDERQHTIQVNAANKKDTVVLRCANADDVDMWMSAIRRSSINSATDTVDIRQWKITKQEIETSALSIGKNIPFIEASIWDFAGQETYYEGHQFFLSRRSVFMVLVDLNPDHKNDVTGGKGRESSFKELRQWLISVQSIVGDAPKKDTTVFIVGNKLDLIIDRNDTSPLRQLKIAEIVKESGLELAWRYVEVSAKLRKNLVYLREEIIRSMAEQSHMGELVPRSYSLVAKYLQLTKQRIEKEDLPPIVDLDSVVNGASLEIGTVTQMLNLMHHWSECIYFGDVADSPLSKIVFLNPEWLTKKVIGSLLFFLGGVVSDLSGDDQKSLNKIRNTKEKNGRKVTKEDLSIAWHSWCGKLSASKRDTLIEQIALLLGKFSLLFERTNKVEGWFLPSTFPISNSQSSNTSSINSNSKSKSATINWNKHSGKMIKMDFIIVGLISQLVGQLINYGFTIDPDNSYRNAIRAILPNQSSTERFLMEINFEKNQISLTIESSNPVDSECFGSESLDLACNVIETRLKNYSGLKYSFLFVCPECLHKNMNQTGLSEEEIQQSKRKYKDGLLCATCENSHVVPVYKWFSDFKRTHCRQHGLSHHDYFISYRVSKNLTEAEAIYNALTLQRFDCYWDKKCLVNGQDWEEGFMNGLSHSNVILLLISVESLEILKENVKNDRNDNVLKEISRALEFEQEKKIGVRVIPVFIGDSKGNDFDFACVSKLKVDESKEFNGIKVIDILNSLLKLQGIKYVRNNLAWTINEIVFNGNESHERA